MTKRAVIIFTKQNNIEDLVHELSNIIVSKGGRILYRKTSVSPIFVYFGGEVGNAERV
ncbi:MAG: hypothetical protein QXO75_01460 [Nitrososphaerota archaeon]